MCMSASSVEHSQSSRVVVQDARVRNLLRVASLELKKLKASQTLAPPSKIRSVTNSPVVLRV